MEESAQQAEQPTSTWSPALKTLRFLKDHRDGFLAVGALVYALGFLTWAIHSLRTGVGFIGLFKAQYIVAGIVPSIFVYATLGYIAMRDRYSTSKPYWRGFTVVFCLVLAIERVFSAVIGVLLLWHRN